MNRIKCSAVLLFALFISHLAYAQNRKQAFNIATTDLKVPGSLYNNIRFIDARADTVHMGFVQLGLLNSRADIVFKKPFHEQLTVLIRELSDSTAQKDTLYFQLRNFSFSELSSTFSEKGMFRFRADLYHKHYDRFFKIGEVDTVVLVKAGDVTKTLLQHAGTGIIEFVRQNLRGKSEDSVSYTMAEIENPDSVEKSKIRLYTTSHYTDGIYLSYKSFAAQIPDEGMVVEEKKNKIRSVKVSDSTGAMVKIKSKNVYGMVYKGQPYVATSYDFYPLTKDNEDFYFIGKIKMGADPMAGFLFGALGTLLSSTNYYTFEMKMDYHTGEFIHIRYIPDSQVPY